MDESLVSGPSGGRGNRGQGSECPARVLAEALSKIAPSNESDTQSILGKLILTKKKKKKNFFSLN